MMSFGVPNFIKFHPHRKVTALFCLDLKGKFQGDRNEKEGKAGKVAERKGGILCAIENSNFMYT